MLSVKLYEKRNSAITSSPESRLDVWFSSLSAHFVGTEQAKGCSMYSLSGPEKTKHVRLEGLLEIVQILYKAVFRFVLHWL